MLARHVVKTSRLLRLRHYDRRGVFRKLASVNFEPSVPRHSEQYWPRHIAQAEAQAGCPHTFTIRDWLLADELTQDLPIDLRNVIQSMPAAHSLVDSVCGLPTSIPWALAVMLFAKAARHDLKPQSDTIHEKLTLLSKLTEMIRISCALHNNVLDSVDGSLDKSFHTANEDKILMFDYFLSKALHILFEKIKDCEVSAAILRAIRDFSDSKFDDPRNAQNIPLPHRPSPILMDDVNALLLLEVAENEWTTRNIMGGVSLLGRSYESAMVLLNGSRTSQTISYKFGLHSGLAWQAASEIASFNASSKTFSLIGAPVLLAIKMKPALYDYLVPEYLGPIDYEGLRLEIKKTNALDHTRRICLHHSAQAKAILDKLAGNNDASKTLQNLISAQL